MEEAMEYVLQDLGSDKFKDLPDVTGIYKFYSAKGWEHCSSFYLIVTEPQARFLIKVRVAKERLYEARVGIIELQKAWDRPGHGECGIGMKPCILGSFLMFSIIK